MAYALSASDKCGRPLGQRGFLQRRVVCMAKGMCLIQRNKTKKYTENSLISNYLVQVGSGLPVYANPLSTPLHRGMHGGVPGICSL